METDALKTAFKHAAEIAQSVPEPLRAAAFDRALDALLGQSAAGRRGAALAPSSLKSQKVSEQTVKSSSSAVGKPLEQLAAQLDRTAHPEISAAPRVLERALWLLRVCKDNHGVDGLGATHIAKLLTEKFRLRASPQAVQQALDDAREFVDRHSPQSGRTVYRIMQGGELYLDSAKSKEAKRAKSPSKVSRRRVPEATGGTTVLKKNSRGSRSKSASKTSSTKGPATILSQLIEEDFFSSPQTIRSIIDHARDNLGYHLKANELSPPLLRALRSKKLKRSQNLEKQYEYSDA